MIERDKLLHLAAGALAAVAGLFATTSLVGGAVVCLAAALGREAYNRWRPDQAKRTGWSWSDVWYTLAGGGVVLACGTIPLVVGS